MARRMHLLLALTTAALLLPATASAKKKKDQPVEEAPPQVESGPNVPGDAASKKFAQALIDAEITDFSPTDANMSAKFIYSRLSFNPDNTWKGVGFVEVIDERMDCTETGTWTMDPAEAPDKAVVNWKVEKTDCAGREVGGESRAVITITKDGIDVLYR